MAFIAAVTVLLCSVPVSEPTPQHNVLTRLQPCHLIATCLQWLRNLCKVAAGDRLSSEVDRLIIGRLRAGFTDMVTSHINAHQTILTPLCGQHCMPLSAPHHMACSDNDPNPKPHHCHCNISYLWPHQSHPLSTTRKNVTDECQCSAGQAPNPPTGSSPVGPCQGLTLVLGFGICSVQQIAASHCCHRVGNSPPPCGNSRPNQLAQLTHQLIPLAHGTGYKSLQPERPKGKPKPETQTTGNPAFKASHPQHKAWGTKAVACQPQQPHRTCCDLVRLRAQLSMHDESGLLSQQTNNLQDPQSPGFERPRRQ